MIANPPVPPSDPASRSGLSVFLDACVLVPMPLADTLLRLAGVGLYQPHWSREVLSEMSRTLQGKFAIAPEKTDRRESAMLRTFPNACVDGYEELTQAMRNDPKDRHVLAAAIHAKADWLVTANIRHFKLDHSSGVELRIATPDDFLSHLFRARRAQTYCCLLEQSNAINRDIGFVLSKLAAQAPRFVDSILSFTGPPTQ